MEKWEKLTTEDDKKKGYNLCPQCKGELEVLTDDEIIKKERCIRGCYVYNFETESKE